MTARAISTRAVAICALLLSAPLHGQAENEPAPKTVNIQKMIDKGDFRGAEIQLRNAAKADPNDPQPHIALSHLYLLTGNLPSAEAEVRVAQQDNASDDDVAPLLAEILQKEGKVDELFQQVQPADRPAKDESVVRTYLGIAHLGLGEYGQAEQLLLDAEKLDEQSVGPKLALGRLYAARDQIDKASAELAAARAIAPDYVEVTRLDATLLWLKNQPDAALAAFEKILSTHPDDVGALASRAELLIAKDRLDLAKADIDHVLKLAPNSPRALYLRAVVLTLQNKLQEADETLTDAGASLSGIPEAYLLEGTVKFSLGEYEQADAALTRYLALVPNQPRASALLARIALQREDYAHAISILQPVNDANPSDVQVAGLLAQAYAAAGNKDKAVALFQRAAQLRPNDTGAQARAAVAELQYGERAAGMAELDKLEQTPSGANFAGPIIVMTDIRSGHLPEAAEAAQVMLKNDPNDVIALNALGIVRAAQHDYPGAEDAFEKVLTIKSSIIEAQHNLAAAYADAGDTAKAEAVLNKILQNKPDDLDALTELAHIAADANDGATAEALLKKAVPLSPSDPTPGLVLAEIYEKHGDFDEALATLRSLKGQHPDNLDVMKALATARMLMKDPQGAAAEFRQATMVAPNSALVYSYYAGYQHLAGDDDGALDSYRKAASLAPDNPDFARQFVAFAYRVKGAGAAMQIAQSFAPAHPTLSVLIQADLLEQEKKPGDAAALLAKAQRQAPDTALVTRLAFLTYQSGKAAQANAMLSAWIKNHPDDIDAQLMLADLMLKENDKAKAQAIYERVNHKAPTNIVALNNLAALYAEQHDPLAQGFAEQAYALAPSGHTEDTIGWVLVVMGDPAKGLTYLRPAHAALPDDPTIQYHLAAALMATGDKEDARSVLEEALKTDTPFDEKDAAKQLFDQLTHG